MTEHHDEDPMHPVRLAVDLALTHHAHRDVSNAAIHGGPVRFSPLTFRLAEAASALGIVGGWVAEVAQAAGTYAEDSGRG